MRTYFIAFVSIIIVTTILLIVGTPLVSLAQETPSLPNPIGTKEDGTQLNLLDVMLRVMQIALAAVDIFALFMFILGGFELLISGGNPNLIKKAKDTLIWATIGILVITLSYSILKFLFEEIAKGFS